jgi:hypothetical protein
MNENPTPTPFPGNEERLKKIQAAQKEMEAMNPSPQQILYEQVLEVLTQTQKAAADAKSASDAVPGKVEEVIDRKLKEDREKEAASRDASEDRIVKAVVAKITPLLSNRDVIDRIDLWGPVITAVIVAGVVILIYLVTHR